MNGNPILFPNYNVDCLKLKWESVFRGVKIMVWHHHFKNAFNWIIWGCRMMQVIWISIENVGDLLYFYMPCTQYARLQNVDMLYLFWTLRLNSLYIPGPLDPNVLLFHHGWRIWICFFDKDISCCLFYHSGAPICNAMVCCVLLIKWCVSAEQRFWSEHGNRYIWLIN